jgi:hypothetical protein
MDSILSNISLLSITQAITSHLYSLSIQIISMTYVIGNARPCLGQAQKSSRVFRLLYSA